MMSGIGLAPVAGVPLGALAGQDAGWRGALWGLAVLAAASALAGERLRCRGTAPPFGMMLLIFRTDAADCRRERERGP
jgi:hypothetical protein